MTKTNGIVLAAFLMASTSPMAFGQATSPAPGTGGDTPTQTEPSSGTGSGTMTPGTGAGTGTDTGTGAGTGTGTDTGTGTGAGTATGTGAATGSLTSDDDVANTQVITSLRLSANAEQDWESEFSDISEDSNVRIVTMSDLEGADTSTDPMLDDVMSDLEDRQSDLRSAIESHDMLTSALEDEGYSVDDVVAAVVQPGTENEVTLVVDEENAAD